MDRRTGSPATSNGPGRSTTSRDVFSLEVYRTITVRTLLTAVGVTIVDAAIAFPVALYMAKVASPRAQRLLVIAVLTPLWASYLVKAYAWRGMFSESGPIAWLVTRSGSRRRATGSRRRW